MSLSVLALLCVGTLVQGQSTDPLIASANDALKAAHVYPNPAVDYLYLKFEQPIAREVTVELHSIIGNNLEVEKEAIDDYEVRVRVKELPAGVYLMDVKKPGMNHHAFKFLKR